jgi:hypothetical protein
MKVSEFADVRHFVIDREDDDHPALLGDVATLLKSLADECQDAHEWPVLLSVHAERTFTPDVAGWNGKGTDWWVSAEVMVGTRGYAVEIAE